ncbi:MAG: tyrosine-type recombinase/integrase [Proteobacteria bacterium]|nr:tyrosine-type recombinase/integrase [Pseudomonadota bacterium]
MAVALEILLLAPMRVGNLCSLSLTEHLTRPGGLNGPFHISIPDNEVKNSVQFEYPLPKNSSDLIAKYVSDFRHFLKGSDSDWLFPGERGHKQPRTMSQQLSKVIYNEVGISMTPHQARHAAAAWLLESDPGNYELVRRLLAHKSLATTTRFYVGLESVSAAKQYADLITRQREENQ